MIQETSREAYDQLTGLGERHKQVIRALVHLRKANNREIAQFLNMPINSITPRVNELRKKNRIVKAGYKLDTITKRNTLSWKLN